MSTLKVATIQDTSGNNSSTPAQVAGGRAKAWVNFNGTGTVAIRDDFNVSSITDHASGDYTANFTTAMANANYCLSGTAADLTPNTSSRWITRGNVQQSNFAQTTSGARFQVAYSVNNHQDGEQVQVVIHGD